MEPLNLMVSLSHFANDKRENKHGLSERVGTGRKGRSPRRSHGWWRSRVRIVARLTAR